MSFVFTLKKIQYLSQNHMNKSKYFLFSMRDQIQMSKIIKGPSALPAESTFEFDLQNNQENTLQIQLWDYDEDSQNSGNPENNLIGVGFLEVPEEDYENSLFNIEDQVMSIYDPQSQEKGMLVGVDLRLGQENDNYDQIYEQQQQQQQQQYSQQVQQQQRQQQQYEKQQKEAQQQYEQKQKEAQQQYEQQQLQKHQQLQEHNKQKYLLQEQAKQQQVQQMMQTSKRISVMRPVDQVPPRTPVVTVEPAQRASVAINPNRTISNNTCKSAALKKLKDSFNQQNSLQFLSNRKVVPPPKRAVPRSLAGQGAPSNQVINPLGRQIGTKVISTVMGQTRVVDSRTAIKKVYL